MNWYDAHYQGDPDVGNVFGRENLRQRRNPLLRAYLANGGRLTEFMLRQAQHEDFCFFPHPELVEG